MLDKNLSNYQICKEMTQYDLKEWFDYKDKQVLHYIDTLYYSIYTVEDTMRSTTCQCFLDLIQSLESCADLVDLPYRPYYADTPFYIGNIRIADFGLHIYVPDCYDVFISKHTRTNETPFIQVQLRSTFLWLNGVEKCIEQSKKEVVKLLDLFNFDLNQLDFKETRIDYCYHTNYIHSPHKFFLPDNVARMQSSRYKSSRYNVEYFDYYKYHIDYCNFGLRNSPVFVRLYLKTKEVVECGYKNKKCFFISVWHQRKLINKFDAWILTHAYVHSNWNYIDMARLEFYCEYGSDERLKQQCNDLIHAKAINYIAVRELANKLVPGIHSIVNIEYQCRREFFKSCKIFDVLPENRLLNVYRNTDLICDYLTTHTLKFVDFRPERDDPHNKSRCQPIPLWKLIQKTKYVENLPDLDYDLTRDYSSKTNLEMLKSRAVTSVSSLSLVLKGDNDDSVLQDLECFASILNDNDIEAARQKKQLRKSKLSQLDELENKIKELKYKLMQSDTGEMI